MTTNRGRKHVIRHRMTSTGESYVVAAKNLKAMKDMGATAEAVRTQRWRPADSLDVPCPCGGTCEPGEKCDRCHARPPPRGAAPPAASRTSRRGWTSTTAWAARPRTR